MLGNLRRTVRAGVGISAALLVLLTGNISREQGVSPQTPLQKSPLTLPANTPLPITLPCFFWQTLFVVEGGINNKSQTRFVIDTGLNACTVTKDIYSNAGLKATTHVIRLNLLEGAQEATEVQMQSLQIGAVTFADVPAALLDAAGQLSRHPHPDAPPAWLGAPLLAAFQVTLDVKARSVILDSPKAPFPKGDEVTLIPLILRDGRPYVKITIPGAKPFLALLDTGAPATMIPTSIAEKLKIKPVKTPAIRLASGRPAHAAQLILPGLRVGEAEQKNFPVVSIVPDNPKDFDPNFGLLGMDFLRRYRVTLNYARQKMALTPYSAAP